jgi:hypothetical protein
MFARLLALCCLCVSVFSSGWAASSRPPAAKLAVYLKTQASQSLRPLDSMKRELARIMQSAGYQLEWRGPQDANIDTSAFLAVVELRGNCEAPSGKLLPGWTLHDAADLASTFVSDGRVLPFSWVNCANLTKLLASALVDQPGVRADFVVGRAVARLIAHEFYHVLMQTRQHSGSGVSKPCFTAADLLNEQFEFEHAVLAELQLCPAGRAPDGPASLPGSIDAEAADSVTGRIGTDRQNRYFD